MTNIRGNKDNTDDDKGIIISRLFSYKNRKAKNDNRVTSLALLLSVKDQVTSHCITTASYFPLHYYRQSCFPLHYHCQTELLPISILLSMTRVTSHFPRITQCVILHDHTIHSINKMPSINGKQEYIYDLLSLSHYKHYGIFRLFCGHLRKIGKSVPTVYFFLAF